MNFPRLWQVTTSPLSTVGKRFRWQVAGVLATPVVAAFLAGRGVSLPLPGCPLRHLTGLPCPTCGMTRSFIALGKGDLATSLQYHAFGPIFVVVFVVIFLHLCSELRLGYEIQGWHTQIVQRYWVIWIAAAMFMGYYFWRLYLVLQGSPSVSLLLSAS
jgi:hypothetical protein